MYFINSVTIRELSADSMLISGELNLARKYHPHHGTTLINHNVRL